MAAMVLHLVSLLLVHQAILCVSMGPQLNTRKSQWKHVNGISKTGVLSDSMLFKSTKESKKASKVPVLAVNDLWSLLLGMKDSPPSETKTKSNPSGLHRLQILTKSSTFLPGLSFLKAEKKPVKNYKNVQTELQPSTFTKKSSKQTAARKLSRERGEVAETSLLKTMKAKRISINEEEIEQVFNSLQDQAIPPTTTSPLERTTGYNSLLTTTIGSLLELNLRLINSIGKQTKAMKAKPKYETTDKTIVHEPEIQVTDQAYYHPGEPVEMRSLPDVAEQQIQKPNLFVDIKPSGKVKRHIDSQHKVQTKSNVDHPRTFSKSSTDFIKKDMKSSDKPVKVHDLQMSHPGVSDNGEFVIRQRTVDFMDPYTLEQQMLKKANMNSKYKSKEVPLRLNSIQPKKMLDLFDIQPANKPVDTKISKSTSTPPLVSVNVKPKESQSGWHGYDGHGHFGSHATSESRQNNYQHDRHHFYPEKKLVEQKNFNIKQIPQSPRNYVEPFANKLDLHANFRDQLLRGQQAGSHRLPYNFIKNAHEFSQSLNSGINQAGSTIHSRMHKSTTVRPPKDWRRNHQLSPGEITWDFLETGRTGQEQNNGWQRRKQVSQSTTERPTADWMLQKQHLPGDTASKQYVNRQIGHHQQHNGQQGGQHMQEMQWKVKQIDQNVQNSQRSVGNSHLRQQESSYLPHDFTRRVGESKPQNGNNGDQYGHREQQYSQSNLNEQWNEGENQNMVWNQNPSYDANTGQYWSDNTYNNNDGYVGTDVNYQTNFEHIAQETYEGDWIDPTYQDQQPQTNFQMPAGWNIYSNVENQDTHNLGPNDAYFSNQEEDSDERR